MRNFILTMLTTVVSLLLTNAVICGVLGIFVKSKKPKIITIIVSSLILCYVLLFEMDDFNTFATIIGVAVAGFIGYTLLSGNGGSNEG